MRDELLSISRAAEVSGCSKDTIKRRIVAGVFPGAERAPGPGPGGPWRIPFADLQAAGMLRDEPADLPHADLEVQLASALGELRALRAHNADLRRLLLRLSGDQG